MPNVIAERKEEAIAMIAMASRCVTFRADSPQ